MSSPATIAETSDNAAPGNTLLIIPDGSPLWLRPNPDDETEILFGWRIDALTALVEQLPTNNFPILIGAKSHTANQLLNGPFEAGWEWDEHLTNHNLAVAPRFVEATHGNKIIGSTDPTAKHIELWFIPRDTFGSTSDGWAGALRRLGFDITSWNSRLSLLQNLEEKRVANAIVNAQRPTGITVGTFVGQELLTSEYTL